MVDTATVNWQVLQANAAAKESIGLVEEGGSLGGLWDLFADAPQTEVGSSSAGSNPWIFSRCSHFSGPSQHACEGRQKQVAPIRVCSSVSRWYIMIHGSHLSL